MSKIKIGKIIYSNRRTLCLHISDDGMLIIKAPNETSMKRIEEILLKKASWILKKQNEVVLKNSQKPKGFLEGENFYFLGEKYPILISSQKQDLIFDDAFFISQNISIQDENFLKRVFANWYKKNAEHILKERVEIYSKKYGLEYQDIKINSAQKRWGSCSYSRVTKTNNLNFTYKLIMAPMQVVDYVIIHELAHIKHRDHSRNFWNFVEEMLPDYRIYEKWLKQNSHLLSI